MQFDQEQKLFETTSHCFEVFIAGDFKAKMRSCFAFKVKVVLTAIILIRYLQKIKLSFLGTKHSLGLVLESFKIDLQDCAANYSSVLFVELPQLFGSTVLSS